jgi:hypothetical protein
MEINGPWINLWIVGVLELAFVGVMIYAAVLFFRIFARIALSLQEISTSLIEIRTTLANQK